MISSKNIAELLYLLLLLSGFLSLHITGIPNPVYFFTTVVALISLLYINLERVYKPVLALWVYSLGITIIFYIGINGFKNYHNIIPIYLSSTLYIYSVLIGSIITVFYNKMPLESRRRIYKNTLNILIIFMLLELFLRLVFSKNSGTFYDYKFGLIYTDSNFTALVILLFIFFYRFLRESNIYKISKTKRILLFILLIFTFSRGAIFTYFIATLILFLPKKFVKLSVIVIIIIICMVSYFLITMPINYFDLSWIDGSLNARLHFIYSAISYYDNLSLTNKLFGIGLNNFQYVSNGRFAHNIILTFVYEFGLMGITFTLLLCTYCYKKIGFNFNYIFLPFFISGLALFSAYSVIFFVFMGCMFIETGTKNENTIYH